jgi:anti-anti-sigma factor
MDTPDFAIVERTDRDVPVLAVRGRIGLAEAWALEGRLLSLLERSDRVIVDLSGVDEVSGGLVGVLLRMRRNTASSGATFALVVTGPPVSTVIATSVLHALVDVAPDVDGAYALLTARARVS